jgi:hypothetical protein
LASVTSALLVSITCSTAGSLLRLPVRPLVLVNLDAMPFCLGDAIRAGLATDDGVFDGATNKHLASSEQPPYV